jgi:hypothetical protein
MQITGATLGLRALLPVAAVSLVGASAPAPQPVKPMQFFEGRTEGTGIVRVFLKKSYRTRSVGTGRIQPDGSLVLVQRIEDDGKPARPRHWKVRQIGPRRYAGTMSQAVGPVTIDQIGSRYRFRFKMKGHLAVEQWLAPLPGGKSANNSMTVRKFGVAVGNGEGTIRKVSGS